MSVYIIIIIKEVINEVFDFVKSYHFGGFAEGKVMHQLQHSTSEDSFPQYY